MPAAAGLVFFTFCLTTLQLALVQVRALCFCLAMLSFWKVARLRHAPAAVGLVLSQILKKYARAVAMGAVRLRAGSASDALLRGAGSEAGVGAWQVPWWVLLLGAVMMAGWGSGTTFATVVDSSREGP
jgi:hypothetical protein